MDFLRPGLSEKTEISGILAVNRVKYREQSQGPLFGPVGEENGRMDFKKIFGMFMAGIMALAMSLSFAGCGGGGGSPSSGGGEKKPVKVSLAMLRLTSSAPLFIAMDKGYFKDEGIDIDPQWFDAAQPIAVATASSKVDVGATGITAGLYNMAAKGQKLYIVADKGREEKGFSSSALLASTAEYDNGLTSIEALKGKRVGITQKGSTFHYMLGRMLEAKGLSLDDVTVVPLGKLSAVMAALQSGQIDACILNEPNITKVKNEGYGKEITQVSAIMPYQTSGIFYSPEFAKNKDAAIRFMKAYNRACNEYYDAVVDKKDPQKLDEIVKIISKYVKTPEEDIRLGLPYIDKNGVLMADDIKTQIDWYSSHGMIDGKLDAKDVVNTSFLEEAMKK